MEPENPTIRIILWSLQGPSLRQKYPGENSPGTTKLSMHLRGVREKEPSIGKRKAFSVKGLELSECERHWTWTWKI